MADTLSTMPPRKKKPAAGKRYPSRDTVKYAGIPREYWDALERMAAQPGGEFERRSVAFLVTIAVRGFLREKGELPPEGGAK